MIMVKLDHKKRELNLWISEDQKNGILTVMWSLCNHLYLDTISHSLNLNDFLTLSVSVSLHAIKALLFPTPDW